MHVQSASRAPISIQLAMVRIFGLPLFSYLLLVSVIQYRTSESPERPPKILLGTAAILDFF